MQLRSRPTRSAPLSISDEEGPSLYVTVRVLLVTHLCVQVTIMLSTAPTCMYMMHHHEKTVTSVVQ
jgi:hypothetical protein